MKRNLFLALTLLVSVLLVACSNGNGDSTAVNDWEPTQYDTVNNSGDDPSPKPGIKQFISWHLVFQINIWHNTIYLLKSNEVVAKNGIWYIGKMCVNNYWYV